MIIDMHTHLGNLLYPGGGELIKKKGVQSREPFNVIRMSEDGFHRTYGIFGLRFYKMILPLAVREERRRNLTATAENLSRVLDRNGVSYAVNLPVAPYVTFDDLHEAHAEDKRLIPFTSVDYTREHDLDATFASAVSRGGKGLKLHPILQCVALNDPRTMKAVQKFQRHKLPVLFHCGFSSYYLGEEKTRQRPELGDLSYAVDLISQFPDVTFIVGHAGAYAYEAVINRFKGNRNVYVDTSFQSPTRVRQLIQGLGAERVLFGSDWPWGNMEPAIAVAKKAARGDTSVERLVFHENAARLLRLQC